MNLRILLCTLICGTAAAGSPASAMIDGAINEMLGTNNYRGTYAYADLGGTINIKPMFNTYRSDTSNGTFNTFSARLGYDQDLWGVGLTGGATPKNNGYSNNFIGVDGELSITPTGIAPKRRISDEDRPAPKGEGLTRVDLGAAITRTAHTDNFTAIPIPGTRQQRIAALPSAVHIGETDFKLSGGLAFLSTLASLEYTHSSYNKNLLAINARAAQSVRLAGVASTIQGFVNNSTSARLEWSELELFSPYVSFTYTTFVIGAPSRSFDAGVNLGLQMISVKVAYEHVVQSGQPDLNYATIGAGLRI